MEHICQVLPKVDNDTRETAIYNSLRTGNMGDLVSVHTNIDNSVELRYPDGMLEMGRWMKKLSWL